MSPSPEAREATSTSGTTSSPLPKACESCRARKIRCNRVIPCANCVSSGITCRPARPVEHRPRILVSNNYEKQVESINERLVGIEKYLRGLSLPSVRNSPRSPEDSPSVTGDTDPPVQYEGMSSFQQQSNMATEFAEALGGRQTSELNEAIRSLKDLITNHPTTPNLSHQLYFTDARSKPPEVDHLPAPFVLALLKQLRDTPISPLLNSVIGSHELEQLCQRVYFPTEPLSLGEQTSLYGLLTSIIDELQSIGCVLQREWDVKTFQQICRRNVSLGVETYEIMAVPTFWNTTALLYATILAQDERRSALAWTFATTAARHLQAMGYHRESVVAKDEPQIASQKRSLFWMVYALERNLALTMGRASCLQEFAIDVAQLPISDDPARRPWDEVIALFVEMAQVQGHIYEQLYSPQGTRRRSDEKAIIIETLSSSLQTLMQNMKQIDTKDAHNQQALYYTITPCEVICYSLQTLVYRASSGPEEGPQVSAKCFEAARKALTTHLRLFPELQQGGEIMIMPYINWALLYCSFTPFIVVFIHAIASHSKDDVELLKQVTASLEHARFVASDVDKLCQTCHVFCRVATTIIESKSNLFGTYNQQTDSFRFPGGMTTSVSNTIGGNGTDDVGIGVVNYTDPMTGVGQQVPMFPQQPSMLPDMFTSEYDGPYTSNEMGEMSMFFGNWMGGSQPVMDLLNVDIAGEQDN